MIDKMINSGQPGAERGALEGARIVGIRTGGYCNKDCFTECGYEPVLHHEFHLTELKVSSTHGPNQLNVIWSDGVVWFGPSITDSLMVVRRYCKYHKKMLLINPSIGDLYSFCDNKLKICVTGNRESKVPGIQEYVCKVIISAFGELRVKEVHGCLSDLEKKYYGGENIYI